uniref:Uncharacterized protein n=1 Tax=Glossina brevipalpis TaxID=37001 RepID=A0A1A9W6Y5_9MUSC
MTGHGIHALPIYYAIALAGSIIINILNVISINFEYNLRAQLPILWELLQYMPARCRSRVPKIPWVANCAAIVLFGNDSARSPVYCLDSSLFSDGNVTETVRVTKMRTKRYSTDPILFNKKRTVANI